MTSTTLPIKKISFFEQSKNGCGGRSVSVNLFPPTSDEEQGTFVIHYSTINLYEPKEVRTSIFGIVDRSSSNMYYLQVRKVIDGLGSVKFSDCPWAGFDLMVFDETQQFSVLDKEREMLHGMTAGTEPNFDALLLLSYCTDENRWAFPSKSFLPKKKDQ